MFLCHDDEVVTTMTTTGITTIQPDLRLFVYKNEADSEGKVVNLRFSSQLAASNVPIDMNQFKKAAYKKLMVSHNKNNTNVLSTSMIKNIRVFHPTGAEITDLDDLQNNDTVYLSLDGKAFYKKNSSSSSSTKEWSQ